MSTQRGGLVHTECGGGGGGIERDGRRGVAGVRIWTPNSLFRHSRDRQRTAAKGLARLLRLLSKGPSIRLSDFRAIVLADSFPQIW